MSYTPDNDSDQPYASDLVSGTHWPYTKLVIGDDGIITRVSDTNPLPTKVMDDVTIADGGNSISVDDGGGSVTVDVGAALPAGSNTIGSVVATSMPAVDRTTDNIGVAPQVDYALLDTTPVTILRPSVDLSADGNVLGAQGSGNKILVHELYISADAACKITLRDGSGGTVLMTAYPGANGGVVRPYNPLGHIKTSANNALYADLTGSANFSVNAVVTVVT